MTVNDFVKQTRPLLERTEFESNNKIRQNILNIRKGSLRRKK